MSIRTLLPFILCLFVLRGAGQTTSPPPSRDFQSWNDVTIAFPIVKTQDKTGKRIDKVSFLFLGTLRLGRNRMFPVDERGGFGFDIRLNKNFTFTPSYLYRHVEPGRGRHATEHQLRFELNYEKAFRRFTIKDRPRIEYRVKHSASDVVNFRNRLTIKVPVRKDDKEIFAPFVADEPFYDFSLKKWVANEFSAGISKKLNSSTSAEFFYMLRTVSVGLPKTTNAIGVNLRFRVD